MRLAHRIERQEPLAATFPEDDSRAPEVISLRRDFPSAPHLNLRIEELPKSLCLYDQPYENVRLAQRRTLGCPCSLAPFECQTKIANTSCVC